MSGSTGTRPLIGVPGMWSGKVQGMRFAGVAVAVEVLRSIDRAGGEPVVLFPGSSEGARGQLSRLDGVVLPGGADVDPKRYGLEPDEHFWAADYDGQDAYEAEVLAAALALEVPLLAICRGLQLLNVERGGTLVPDLDVGSVVHQGAMHRVDPAAGSLLASITGCSVLEVSSYHHQAIDRLGNGLVVTAAAPDGVVEAVELPGAALLAVQWHPEDRAGVNPTDHALFEWVVGAADRLRQERGGLVPATRPVPQPAPAERVPA